jgi:nucleotide-binding universal stress UspA family protein
MTVMNDDAMFETFDGTPHALRMTPAIVVGMDASDTSRAALRWAAEQCQLTGLPLRVVHAWQMPALGAVPGRASEYSQTFASDARARATRWVLDTLDSRAADIRWTLEIIEGAAGAVLVARSRSASLLVLGTREHTGLRRAVLGSVSHYCLSHAVPPVVAVPASDDAGELLGSRDEVFASPGPLL